MEQLAEFPGCDFLKDFDLPKEPLLIISFVNGNVVCDGNHLWDFSIIHSVFKFRVPVNLAPFLRYHNMSAEVKKLEFYVPNPDLGSTYLYQKLTPDENCTSLDLSSFLMKDGRLAFGPDDFKCMLLDKEMHGHMLSPET